MNKSIFTVLNVFLASIMLTSISAEANEAAPKTESAIVNCWDGTFAYTQFSAKQNEVSPHLINVQLSSQDQELLKALIELDGSETLLGWGDVETSIVIPAESCSLPAHPSQEISCTVNSGIFKVAYDESWDVRRIVKHQVRDIEIKTSIVGSSLHLFLKLNKRGRITEFETSFRLKADGTCMSRAKI
jgi:hypothetical protein